MAKAVEFPELSGALAARRQTLQHALASCGTEADIVQVLYANLHPIFGYEAINLHVLEHEGSYHSLAVDNGVLQDVRRRLLSESITAPLYKAGRSTVMHPADEPVQARGPGAARRPRTLIWVPIFHRGEAVGSVLYQALVRRPVPAEELAFLEDVHRNLGVQVSNAYLNEISRNQAVRLSALNDIARALSSTLDEKGVVAALHSTISKLLPVDLLELVTVEDETEKKARVLRYSGTDEFSSLIPLRSPQTALARATLKSGRPYLGGPTAADSPFKSVVCVPVVEGGRPRAALSIFSQKLEAYEDSTVVFLEQVADEVSLALRNAWSYAAIEAQRRRLEVVNAVGRRLASSLDKWAIMRTLREELDRHLEFDQFVLITITEAADGPMAEGYLYDSGFEQPIPNVPLAGSGPGREAYETGRPVLIRRSPWARQFEEQNPAQGSWVMNEGAAVFVTQPSRPGRVATRSFVWVPVLHGERITALLSLQSYEYEAFSEWHVALLQDVAAHVSLALANAEHFAAAQRERRRLEALHLIELAVAGSADERQIAEAVFATSRDYLDASHLALAYLDPQGRVTGFALELGVFLALDPMAVDSSSFFRRLIESGQTIAEAVPDSDKEVKNRWRGKDPRLPRQVLYVPVFQSDRVVGALSAQRLDDRAFGEQEIQLLESAAPVVGIALRTVRLHRANELALAHSVRIQEVAALAGHDLASVVSSVAEQARDTLDVPGAACWAFDIEGRVTARASAGDPAAERVLSWSGRTADRSWDKPPRSILTGEDRGVVWNLIPLWYADRLVGAIGSVPTGGQLAEPGNAALDFARHAAIAIENARLVAETRGRIRTLEAVAAFTELDITRPASTRAEMARLIERALAGSKGALWLRDGSQLLRPRSGRGNPQRVDAGNPAWLARALRAGTQSRNLRKLLQSLPGAGRQTFATPIMVQGELFGMLTADAGGASTGETRRLMSVLAGQAGVVLGRLQLVDALERERRQMNAILRHSPVGVILEDAQGRIVYANPEIERIYGVPAASLPDRHSDEVLAQAGAIVVESEAPEPDAFEVRIQDPERVVQVRRVPIPGVEDEPAGVLTLHEDITQQRLALEAKDLMLRAIGHEVRSPAAAMKATLASIIQWEHVMEPAERQGMLEEAYESSDRLLSLVEGQLIIAKLETKRFEPNPTPVLVQKSLEQVMGVLYHRYGDRVQTVQVKLPAGLRPAYCEPTHLDQVLANLIGNALEYTRAPVTVTARGKEGWLEITVADHGHGLPADRVQSLFQKAGQAGQNRARGGLGLGLYLCRLVVERSFGGRIWLGSTGKGGTTFKFTVPATALAARQAAMATVGS